MSNAYKIATIFGGTGFIGRQVVRGLAKAGYRVKVATRVPERAYFLKPCGTIGQVVPFACRYSDEESIAEAVRDADVVVNCVGILYEKKKGDFTRTHSEIPARIANACKKAGVKRFVHISAPGLEQDPSRYAQTKLAGENAVRRHFPDATILRPSVIFGPDDAFFNKFARLSLVLPALPLIGGGRTKFQPVYVGDVADAVMACLGQDGTACGKTYELGGPEVLTFRDIYERLFKYTGRKKILINLPWRIASIEARFLEFLPGPPLLTRDQIKSLKTDYVVSGGASRFEDLGITPKSLDLILPLYLTRYRKGGQ